MFVCAFALTSLSCIAQTYDTTKHYLNQGLKITECEQDTNEITQPNSYGSPVVTGYYQKCKVLTWEQEQFDGTIYMWFNNRFIEIPNSHGKFWKAHWEEVKLELK